MKKSVMKKDLVSIQFTADHSQYFQPFSPDGFTRLAIGAASNEADAYRDAVDQIYSGATLDEIRVFDRVLPKRAGNARKTLGSYIGGQAAKDAYACEENELYIYCTVCLSDAVQAEIEEKRARKKILAIISALFFPTSKGKVAHVAGVDNVDFGRPLLFDEKCREMGIDPAYFVWGETGPMHLIEALLNKAHTFSGSQALAKIMRQMWQNAK